MAKTANLYARIEPDVKEQAESILSALGIPASNAINMFYKQIILHRGLPFEVKMPAVRPVDTSALSDAEMDVELDNMPENVILMMKNRICVTAQKGY
ncbi:MAG: type II toxin-antitoxin system RelB/DinJ family antitoxin [Lachnospiraceae bacterium]|nr:type II toxin-antitoxin system RelB/DinJ family antitoxin [Lachnospiraceae bacterium]